MIIKNYDELGIEKEGTYTPALLIKQSILPYLHQQQNQPNNKRKEKKQGIKIKKKSNQRRKRKVKEKGKEKKEKNKNIQFNSLINNIFNFVYF